MKRLYLVSCVSKKLCQAAPAKEFYCSEWFCKARRYVESTRCKWFILSAKYGLVTPHAVLRPYNLTLKTLGLAERRLWAYRVLKQFDNATRNVDEVIFLAGERYREFLVKELKDRNIRVQVPMEGLGIGRQLAWLKRNSPH